ncbi:MAG: ATP-binding protein [Candidatus Helarchaeota archaeon]
MIRNIIKIDEDKCTGCGQCVINCAEGALKIIDGKAKVVSESYCDGLGACIGNCPEGALSIERREAEEFDEEAVKIYLENTSETDETKIQSQQTLPCGCPSSMTITINEKKSDHNDQYSAGVSQLRNWPVQLKLLNPNAPYFKNADLLIVSDCVPFSYANFHQRFLKDKILIMFCPKLDHGLEDYIKKLTDIFKINNIKSISMVHMEVACCKGIERIVSEALKNSGKNIIIKDYTISINGEII